MSEPASPFRPPRKQTGVPRRFGMGVMLLITTMYAVLFAAIRTLVVLTAPAESATAIIAVLFVVIVGFVTIIGLSQAILYKGRNPRRASIVTGMALGGLVALVWVVATLIGLWAHPWFLIGVLMSSFLRPTVMCVVGGGLAGYLAGGLIAGVFLLFNKLQPPLEDAEEKPPDAPADDTSRLSERVSELARLAGRRVRRYRGEFAELFPPGNQTGVPRRFGVAVMLVVTTMYAVLFAAIRTWVVVATLGPPAPAIIAALFVVIVGFFTIVGLSQAILFKGRNPRWASIITGTILGPPAAMGVMLLASAPGLNSVDKLLAGLICGLPLWLALGGCFGYLAGGLIAGVFLLFNKVQPPLEDPEADESDARQPDAADPVAEHTEPPMNADQRGG